MSSVVHTSYHTSSIISSGVIFPVFITSYILLNPLMGTLKPQSNGPLYSNTVTGTLAVDGRGRGLLHLVQ